MRISGADYQGAGVYQQVGGAHDRRFGPDYDRITPGNVFAGYGNYQGVGQMPTLPELNVLYETEEISGIKVLKYAYKEQGINILQMLTFQADSPPGDTITGVAAYVLMSTGHAWVQEFVQNGYVVMVQLTSVPTAVMKVIATRDPQIVLTYAGRGGDFVVIDGPVAVTDAAQAMATGVQPPVVTAPAQPVATAQQQAAAAAAQQAAVGAKTPSWLVPALFVVGGAAVVAVAVAASKKKG